METGKPIKNRFLYFKTQEAFDDAYRNGNITNDHIAVVCNWSVDSKGRNVEQTTAKIYAHGKWISGTDIPEGLDPTSMIQILINNGFDRKMKWS